MAHKWIYAFEEGNKEMRNLLGGKGANLAEMTRLGINVPPGFTATTEACIAYYNAGNKFPEGFVEQVENALATLEQKTGRKFGSKEQPLLVSVRSGARVSMPGMMDTILNLGLNDETVEGLSNETNNPRFAWDSYRRLIQMFANVVYNVNLEPFHEIFDKIKHEQGVQYDHEVNADNLKKVVSEYKKLFNEIVGSEFPQDTRTQLFTAIQAVFESWNNKRAIAYRKHEGIPDDWGTAANVQQMVFGNMGDDSGTGVLFTRNPSTGDKELFGEFLPNAQGEDVVAGIRTPVPIEKLKDYMPEIFEELKGVAEKLEQYYKNMQDIEFTIMKGKLYILQTRNGKRTGVAAVKIAYDLVGEGLLSKKEAVLQITPRDVENCLFPRIPWINEKKGLYEVTIDGVKQSQKAVKIGQGLPAGPGAATGIAIFDSTRAETYKNEHPDEEIILVRTETSPEDFHGMVASSGILTIRGGITSHAAIVSRQIGKSCIVGAESSGLKVVKKGDTEVLVYSDGEIKEGDFVTIDGFSGAVYKGRLPILHADELPKELAVVLDWADEFARLQVRTNADKPKDAAVAFSFKATGIGLARTEHQFFEKERLPIVQKMILAETTEERKKFLDQLLEFQKEDFKGLFEVAEGKPITIRLIDPPLHEFLPKEDELKEEIATLDPAKDKERIEELTLMLKKTKELHEANPMMGLRGCRLGLLYPEIIEMQSRAILEAALDVKASGKDVHPEIMVPLISTDQEFLRTREVIERVASEVMEARGITIPYKVGTMIEIPRAALIADKIAGGEKGAEFFSFGTNDLHQMTFGFSRDDAGKFLPMYVESGILPHDPFVSIDEEGVGQLMEMCVNKGRKVRPTLKIGICGEQGGDPQSIDFCHRIGLDYVSCSPYRVPVARLAAAHANLKNE